MCEICKVVDKITVVPVYPKRVFNAICDDTTYNLLLDFVKNVAFEYRDPPFTLSSGKMSNYYFDCRKVFSSAYGFDLAGRVMGGILKRMWPEVSMVGGLATGAIPVANAIMSACFRDSSHCLNSFYVRKELKDHGKTDKIVGIVKKGDHVLIVEDVITTGQSAGAAVAAILELGAIPVGVLALVDRLDGGGAYLMQEFSIPVISVFTIFNFVEKNI